MGAGPGCGRRTAPPPVDSSAPPPADAAMKPTLAMVAAVLVIAVAFCPRAEANPLSIPCEGENCLIDLNNCEFGIIKDIFGRKVCAKGPGQRCGGPYDLLGKCGDGLNCKCGVCSGCDLRSLECYSYVGSSTTC